MTRSDFSRARIERDRNFDGKFFFGVKTTGIFCRPSCPSPRAKEKNVLYFNTIFEALEHGFRPCLRCRPDLALEYGSGNPESHSIVSSALQMIYDGYLSYHSLGELAESLGISDRHLRQLFLDRLGIPPVKIAKYHKALFAKKLLLYSDQSITDIACASGFGSIRQFNDVFKEIFGKTPTALRKDMGEKGVANENTTLQLKYSQPFHFSQIISFMKDRALKGVEVITDSSYSRTFRIGEAKGYFIVTDCPDKFSLELKIISDNIKCYMEVYNRVRRVFDLDTDFKLINEHLCSDEILSIGMEDGGVPRLPRAFDPFEFVVRAILGQQISVKAATTIAGRITEKAGIKCGDGYPEGLDYFFPDVVEMSDLDLDGIGLTKTRMQTLETAVEAILDGYVKLTAQQTLEKFHKDFSALKGIGDWTVNYVAMRGLGLMDSFPAGDLGVVKALAKGGIKPSQKEVLKIAEKWRPYRAYATLCLWNSLGDK